MNPFKDTKQINFKSILFIAYVHKYIHKKFTTPGKRVALKVKFVSYTTPFSFHFECLFLTKNIIILSKAIYALGFWLFNRLGNKSKPEAPRSL